MLRCFIYKYLTSINNPASMANLLHFLRNKPSDLSPRASAAQVRSVQAQCHSLPFLSFYTQLFPTLEATKSPEQLVLGNSPDLKCRLSVPALFPPRAFKGLWPVSFVQRTYQQQAFREKSAIT